ncbi:hypothetical protein [Salarchaeum japonicum]|uniref:hypothetical protein n=1 Tax=Salarchaeum japonicum TaxID=555573 RepID=UPI001D0A036C|nr:hypothetical protein [Salarchaeum japonicum]
MAAQELPVGTNTTTSGPASGANDYRSTGYGIVALLEDDGDLGSVEETIIEGVTVHNVEWHSEGYALVQVRNTKQVAMTLGATDSNSIVASGHGRVAGVSFTVPPQTSVLVKVPASVRDGDQTIVVSLDVEHQFAWSNPVEPGGGVGPGLVPTGAMWFVALAGSTGGVVSTTIIFGLVSKRLKSRDDIV